MSRRWMIIALTAAAISAPGLGHAQEGRLNRLEDRITALEDQLRESQGIIKDQQEQLKAGGGLPAVGAADGSLDKFLGAVQIGGHLAASYSYNLKRPKTNSFTNTFCQFNCNHNEFSLDAAKLEIGKVASEPGTIGFQFDLLYGQNASILRNLAPGVDRVQAAAPVTDDGTGLPTGTTANLNTASVASDSDVFLQQAFASYNLGGTEFKLGKFETFLGYEVLDGDGNSNITHGSLFTFAIPAFHTGLLLSGSMGESLAWGAGVVNGFNNTREAGDNKGFIGKLAWTQGPVFAQVSSFIGTLGETRSRFVDDDNDSSTAKVAAVVADDGVRTSIFDAILQFQPADSTKLWVNADVGSTQARNNRRNPDWRAVAVGARQQLSDKLYVALRGEYFQDDGGSRLGFLDPATDFSRDRIDLYTATLTFGYQVAPNLLARLEYRKDITDCDDSDCNFFFKRGGVVAGGRDKNDLAVLELIYSFE